MRLRGEAADLNELLGVSAARYPDRPAIIVGSRTMDYGELERRTNRLAHLLVEIGVRKGDRVGLYLEKSAEAIVGAYGALKAGAAYVPLDPQAPVARAAHIARDCGIKCLLTGAEKQSDWPSLIRAGAPTEQFVVLNLKSERAGASEDGLPPGCALLGTEALEAQDDSRPPDIRLSGDELAYILYTSGSTGAPKGVMLSHRNSIAFVEWAVREFGLNSQDRVSNHAPLHFDLSTFDIFAANRAGAATVVIPRQTTIFAAELLALIKTARMTVWYSVPSALSLIARRGPLPPDRLASLRVVLFAGEVFPPKYLRHLMASAPHARFANLYGPTETNVCSWYEVGRAPDADGEPVPIGKPIPGDDLFLVTEQGRLASRGEVGELYVQGATVMLGYWGEQERTDSALLLTDCAPKIGQPAYRTGDLAWQDGNGNYRLTGRRDTQIKTRGYRVELGEIEATLRAHPSVSDCAVIALPDELVTNRLGAVTVVEGPVMADELARFCSQRLPAYMVPEIFEFKSALPQTTTGKTDRQLLAEELAGRHLGRAHTR